MRRVEVEGEFVPNGLVLLDNKTRKGVAGYEVDHATENRRVFHACAHQSRLDGCGPRARPAA